MRATQCERTVACMDPSMHQIIARERRERWLRAAATSRPAPGRAHAAHGSRVQTIGRNQETDMPENHPEIKPTMLERLRYRVAERQARHADRGARRRTQDIEGAARQAESSLYKSGFFTTKH
jgi:hypothetical protein